MRRLSAFALLLALSRCVPLRARRGRGLVFVARKGGAEAPHGQ